ncbi:MAG TPA: hypothetical protein DCG75_05490 [Bacteroidales bacterium]|nr:hypothetical protein [Bacteroidales bacterium]
MEKFSLFDFASFILPGCTFLILSYLILSFQNIQFIPNEMPSIEVIIIPLLLVGYLFGHLLSLIGKKTEKWITGMKTPWITYLKNNSKEAEIINSKCISLFNAGFINENKEIDIAKSDKLYDTIYEYIEFKDKDEKIKILYSQYGFFRNSSAVWISLFSLLLVILILKLVGVTFIISTIISIILYSIIVLLLSFASLLLCKKRKLLTMYYVYRTFLIMNLQDKNEYPYEKKLPN